MKISIEKLQAQDPQLRGLEKLYHASFPDYEAKPFEMIVNGVKEGRMDSYILKAAKEKETELKPAGLAFLIKGKDIMLLDYLAINPDFQSGGLGSRMIKELSSIYDQPLIIEIESTNLDIKPEDQDQRERRKSFYIRNGFFDCNQEIELFGVQMELMSTHRPIAYPEYFDLLDQYLQGYQISASDNICFLSQDRKSESQKK